MKRIGLLSQIATLCVGYVGIQALAQQPADAAPRDRAAATICAAASSLRAMASTIYLYEDGVPVEDPSAYIQEGDVYDIDGFVGTLDVANETILGTDGTTVIGYVLVNGPGGP